MSAPPRLGGWLRAFRYATWLGVLANLGFVLPALLTPDLLETTLGPGMVELSYLWVGAAGLLLLAATLFYLPAARDPLRYPVYAWLSVVGRGLAAAFWLWQDARWHLPGSIERFWILDGSFFLVFLVTLTLGMPPEHRPTAANLRRAAATWRPRPLAGPAATFRLLVWAACALAVAFAVVALASPEWPAHRMGSIRVPPTFLWLGNCGMLLVQLALFSLPAAERPERYPAHAWLVAAAHALAGLFWAWQAVRWSLTGPSAWLWLPTGLLAILLAWALQRASPAEHRIGRATPIAWARGLGRDVGHLLPSLLSRALALAVLALFAAVGFVLWQNLARAEPDTVFDAPEDQFKYGAIGLGQAYRVPLYLWDVLPEVCADLVPGGPAEDPKDAWRALGLLFEEGHDTPIGFARRRIGYPSVEPTCSLCHTGSLRETAGGPRRLILGGSAHQLDLEAFQWFLYDCAASDGFTPDGLLAEIEKRHPLGWVERQVYRELILPFAKTGLAIQRDAYAWQKSRPRQGRGRTDTFNPTKIVVFHMPDDHTIGTVDLPVIWNQRARVGLSLHWDGNNDDIEERNFAAAMAVGASPFSVLPDNFRRVTDFVLDLAPPKYPWPVDAAAAERGWQVYRAECAHCHELGGPGVGTVTPIDEIGTDRNRLDSFTAGLVEDFHAIHEGPFQFDAYTKTDGYANLPIDGLWARAPFLHNGSAATLRDLLAPPAERTARFTRGSDVYDPERMGFVSGPPEHGPGFVQDASVAGNGNAGHTYGTDLDEASKRDLIEFLKTL